MIRFSTIFVALFLVCQMNGQPAKPSSSEIYHGLQRLNVLGSVLYIAAHPDDENTRLISYMANDQKYRTGYLSLTRGDGGQNLVGPEIREMLGIIRTNELLQARAVDGGVQMFTRANDFGYSKHPDETLEIWNEEEVLGDVVWAIRKFRPDIIVNRFDHRTPGRTHGHHTSSAMLSVDAFDIAGEKSAYKEQLDIVDTWQPRRLFFNTSWWFYGSRENFEKADKSRMVSVDVGTFSPILGLSTTEIASLSRSMHKSQGFGSTGTRGSRQEYLELIKGDMPDVQSDPMKGINTSWTRVRGGEAVQEALNEILDKFDFERPDNIVRDLAELYQLISKTGNDHWREIKLEEVRQLIRWCSGAYIEAVVDRPEVVPGATVNLDIEMINRSEANIQFNAFEFTYMDLDTTLNINLESNQDYLVTKSATLSAQTPYTNAYWLDAPYELGMYTVEDQAMVGRPETPRSLVMSYVLNVEGIDIPFETDVVYKRNDRVDGETYRPVEVVPAVSVNIGQPVYIFESDGQKLIEVKVEAHKEDFEGVLHIDLPDGWRASPDQLEINLERKGETEIVGVEITPPFNSADGELKVFVTHEGRRYDRSLTRIDYDHIPYQMVFTPARSRIVRIDLEKAGNSIGYISGAGDVVAQNLRNIGYQVRDIPHNELMTHDYSNYDAVILGIRAFNTVPELKFANERLFEYVKQGGTLLVQYNTSRGLVTRDLGPYPLELSRDRVTDEYAEITILEAQHPIFNEPNQIVDADFDGWVQERGLYFPDEWDDAYTPLISCFDKGEEPKLGGILAAKYGEGHYVYSGISWFRQLPAGVPGAFRLLANILALGNKSDNE